MRVRNKELRNRWRRKAKRIKELIIEAKAGKGTPKVKEAKKVAAAEAKPKKAPAKAAAPKAAAEAKPKKAPAKKKEEAPAE